MATTLTILKPDSVGAGNAGNILALLSDRGLSVRAMKMLRLSEAQARAFYEIHSEQPWFEELIGFMTSGPVVAAVLEHDDAVPYLRQVMGATNSKEAAEGTVRNLYGTDVQENAIHGSDSAENAAREVAFFFSESERLAAR